MRSPYSSDAPAHGLFKMHRRKRASGWRARVAAACKNASMSVRAESAKLGERLQYATMAWNSAECIVALAAGFVAGSIALVGFGFDSAIEVTSSVAALWRLRSDRYEAAREAAERRTLRIIGVCFLVLAVYVAYGAARDLLLRQPPEHSLPGIVIAALSLIVMPLLVRAKRRVAAGLESGAPEGGAPQT